MNRSLALSFAVGALASACAEQAAPTPSPSASCDGDVCTLSGTLTEDLTLTADKKWLLSGGVFVGDDTSPTAAPTTLTIEPGTTIYGDTATLSFLLVTRGSKIIADGTAEAPIVFTSAKDVGSRARGDWGGLVVNGQAPVNGCSGDPCTLLGEAGTGTYGGSDANDDSGVLRYVRVEFGGALIDDENELNGFAFQGVGAGTTIEHVQAHMCSDDCVEFFGGTANASHVVCTGIGDDNLDWTFGWTGHVQFLVGQQHGDAGGNGIEADNNESNHMLTPTSRPILSNVTLIGSGGANSGLGVLLRRGTQVELHNSVVMGFGEACFDMDDDATFAAAVQDGALTGDTIIKHTVFSCDTLTDDAAEDPYALSEMLLTLNDGNAVADPKLTNTSSLEAPDFRPLASSPLLSGATMPSGSFFFDVSFKGAFGTDDNWTAGWTAMPLN
jgi:hypothetical protein